MQASGDGSDTEAQESSSGTRTEQVGGAMKPKRSQSYQCTQAGSAECGAYAHGNFLHDQDHSRSLDSGMVGPDQIDLINDLE